MATPVGPAPDTAPGDESQRVRESRSPFEGGLGLALNMLSAVTLITYTLVPLPGQRDIGWWNYVIGGCLFLGSIAAGAVVDERDVRRLRRRFQARDR
jgi:hypothetical protein